jgi:hypothetical protein
LSGWGGCLFEVVVVCTLFLEDLIEAVSPSDEFLAPALLLSGEQLAVLPLAGSEVAPLAFGGSFGWLGAAGSQILLYSEVVVAVELGGFEGCAGLGCRFVSTNGAVEG